MTIIIIIILLLDSHILYNSSCISYLLHFFINIFNYIILYLCAFMLNNIKLILNSIILLLYIYIHLHLWHFKYYLNISYTHLYLYLHIHILLLQESIIDIIRLEIFHSFIINIFNIFFLLHI